MCASDDGSECCFSKVCDTNGVCSKGAEKLFRANVVLISFLTVVSIYFVLLWSTHSNQSFMKNLILLPIINWTIFGIITFVLSLGWLVLFFLNRKWFLNFWLFLAAMLPFFNLISYMNSDCMYFVNDSSRSVSNEPVVKNSTSTELTTKV